ncbi:shikimate kinase [Synechococcus sp. RSCCF101]|uniref:shikimate kinase n=1 Tax=Synechococcus sp. RSCCF101 TaxID=2511069 RepID=UPI0012492424|nr:shikimate kinase [Synechococcus sp. RSCCF101]QEY32922.1 shikimate kinase [Synechococcus sp. RSCCF101]
MQQVSALRSRLGGRNLYLVGMMGAGKSTVGRPLAEQLGYGFVDADSTIEACSGRSISAIFAEDGERGFRAIETAVLNQIACRHSLVVATGGGIVTEAVNWGHMHQGLVLWLDPDRNVLLQRLREQPGGRPLLAGEGDPAARLDALLEARRPLYAQADVHLAITQETPEQVVSALLEAIAARLQAPGLGGSSRTANH